ncbi:hypothetical protein PSHT_00861, partial [Puccinia striiformis]
MDDPVNQIKGVIRSLIEPYRHRVIAENVSSSKIQDMRKEYIRDNPIIFYQQSGRVQGVMFDETKEHCTIELVETMDSILHYKILSSIKIRVLIRIDLTKGADGKYLISKSASSMTLSDWRLHGGGDDWNDHVPGLISLGKIIGSTAGIGTALIGQIIPIHTSSQRS